MDDYASVRGFACTQGGAGIRLSKLVELHPHSSCSRLPPYCSPPASPQLRLVEEATYGAFACRDSRYLLRVQRRCSVESRSLKSSLSSCRWLDRPRSDTLTHSAPALWSPMLRDRKRSMLGGLPPSLRTNAVAADSPMVSLDEASRLAQGHIILSRCSLHMLDWDSRDPCQRSRVYEDLRTSSRPSLPAAGICASSRNLACWIFISLFFATCDLDVISRLLLFTSLACLTPRYFVRAPSPRVFSFLPPSCLGSYFIFLFAVIE
ncbi:hypothetical protein R3P38DRAFT_1452412 [Favolaschia claudopus]|uniref:Uncharacterized protein n=1 Tax=Favolaschia claudopus TaxID=2862362 RepID=A0AAW0AKL7_9AGAR